MRLPFLWLPSQSQIRPRTAGWEAADLGSAWLWCAAHTLFAVHAAQHPGFYLLDGHGGRHRGGRRVWLLPNQALQTTAQCWGNSSPEACCNLNAVGQSSLFGHQLVSSCKSLLHKGYDSAHYTAEFLQVSLQPARAIELSLALTGLLSGILLEAL